MALVAWSGLSWAHELHFDDLKLELCVGHWGSVWV